MTTGRRDQRHVLLRLLQYHAGKDTQKHKDIQRYKEDIQEVMQVMYNGRGVIFISAQEISSPLGLEL